MSDILQQKQKKDVTLQSAIVPHLNTHLNWRLSHVIGCFQRLFLINDWSLSQKWSDCYSL